MTWPNVVALISVLATIVVPLLAHIRGKRSDGLASEASLEGRFDALAARYRVLEDYCYDLRSDVALTGVKPRPWPKELTGHDG